METAGTVLPSSWFSFNFRVVDMPQYNRIWTLTILDAEELSNSNPPNNPTNANCRATTNCASSNGCSACRDTSFFYRICYHASRGNTVGMPNCTILAEDNEILRSGAEQAHEAQLRIPGDRRAGAHVLRDFPENVLNEVPFATRE